MTRELQVFGTNATHDVARTYDRLARGDHAVEYLEQQPMNFQDFSSEEQDRDAATIY
jgi:hypothetical protein